MDERAGLFGLDLMTCLVVITRAFMITLSRLSSQRRLMTLHLDTWCLSGYSYMSFRDHNASVMSSVSGSELGGEQCKTDRRTDGLTSDKYIHT